MSLKEGESVPSLRNLLAALSLFIPSLFLIALSIPISHIQSQSFMNVTQAVHAAVTWVAPRVHILIWQLAPRSPTCSPGWMEPAGCWERAFSPCHWPRMPVAAFRCLNRDACQIRGMYSWLVSMKGLTGNWLGGILDGLWISDFFTLVQVI